MCMALCECLYWCYPLMALKNWWINWKEFSLKIEYSGCQQIVSTNPNDSRPVRCSCCRFRCPPPSQSYRGRCVGRCGRTAGGSWPLYSTRRMYTLTSGDTHCPIHCQCSQSCCTLQAKQISSYIWFLQQFHYEIDAFFIVLWNECISFVHANHTVKIFFKQYKTGKWEWYAF